MVYVEIQVLCGATGCVAKKMRRTQGSPPSYQTPFEDDHFARFIFNEFVLSSGTPSSLNDTSLAYQYSALPGTETDPYGSALAGQFNGSSSQGQEYSVGDWLTPSINAYYQLSQNPFLTAANDDQTLNFVEALLGILAGNQTNYSSSFSTTKMKGAPYNPHYAIFIPWIVVDFISCKIL
jgi:hypothetical protein